MTTEKIRSAVDTARKYGMKIHASIQIGLPNETEEDVKKTIKFLEELDIDEVGIFNTRLQPGTELEENCEKYGLTPTKKVYYSTKFSETEKLKKEKIREIITGLKKRFNEVNSLKNFIFENKYLRHRVKNENEDTILFLYLNNKCNNNCQFCSPKFNKKSEEEYLNTPLKINKVVISGGEPTITSNKKMYRLIKEIKNNYKNAKIELNTNARIFYYKKAAEYYINKLGIKNYRVTLIINDFEEEHDKTTKTKGSFKQTTEGIKNLKEAGAKITIKKIITNPAKSQPIL